MIDRGVVYQPGSHKTFITKAIHETMFKEPIEKRRLIRGEKKRINRWANNRKKMNTYEREYV